MRAAAEQHRQQSRSSSSYGVDPGSPPGLPVHSRGVTSPSPTGMNYRRVPPSLSPQRMTSFLQMQPLGQGQGQGQGQGSWARGAAGQELMAGHYPDLLVNSGAAAKTPSWRNRNMIQPNEEVRGGGLHVTKRVQVAAALHEHKCHPAA